MEPQTQLILALIITIVLTSLLIWGTNWIKRNKEQHPEIYKGRGVIGTLVYLILNIGDF